MVKKIKKQVETPIKVEIQEQPIKQQQLDQTQNKNLNQDQQIDIQNQNKPKKKKKHARILIRNLIIDINQKLLKKLCSKYGEIEEINIPKHPVKNCTKGYAFVQYKTKNMCLKAIKQLNQTVYKGRTIIVDMALGKNIYSKIKQQEKANNNKIVEQQPVTIKTEAQVQKVQTNKQIKKQVKKEITQQVNNLTQKKQEDLSTTIFIRNVPLDATQQDLFNFFKKYGRIKFTKLVIDKQTGDPKGTAFLKFKQPNIAQKLINYSRDYEQSLGINGKTKQTFVEDPTINLQLNGRILKIFPTQTRQNITNKLDDRLNKQNKSKIKPLAKIRSLQQLIQMQGSNKRNLQLALEGIYKSEQWMKKQDQQKFSIHQKQKLQKLKNPNNSVSQTRVILKYLPRTMTQQDILTISKTFLQEKYPQKKNTLNYCKLMLDKNRQKSIGIAFIQFSKPQVSLQFIRWIKKSSKFLFNKNVVLCQFVIQDAKKIQLLSKKIKKNKG